MGLKPGYLFPILVSVSLCWLSDRLLLMDALAVVRSHFSSLNHPSPLHLDRSDRYITVMWRYIS
ncbi:hypothetical protein [Chroococcidiopsis sp [FACHB-1243]]|uniref:hypothetical protein n=1 Tax=Chroococcidiopsis sp. [FACHB-1243] TaxID=2692781 RepID=UPI00177DB2C2|nr:hypothetical protein [Chroococcidiopsis sp. [FACHB-1243]]